MTREEAKSCIGTIKMLQRLAYNIHGVMDVIDADNCKKIIKALEQEPCEDCISRQAAIDETWKEPTYTDPLNVLTEVRDRIKALPSAQPKRMPGKWKKISPASIYECSVCGQNIMTQDIDAYRYCHGCGADMRGEQDDSV